MTDIVIRRFSPQDQSRWRELWRGYNDFYRRTVEDRVTDRLWERLLAGDGEPFGYAAELDGKLVGLAHYYFQPSTSDWEPRCYLQDLFADPNVRGKGVGRALIEALYEEADRHGAAQTYWMTETTNTTARLLYDRIGKPTAFMKYMR